MVEKADSFEKTTNPITKKCAETLLPIEVIGKVSDDFIEKVQHEIQNYSQEWISIFKKNHYKVILTDSVTSAYKSQGMINPGITKKEILNPKGVLGATHHSADSKTNFFCFCDNGELSKKYIKNTVNHEFGHGIVNINTLYKNTDCINALKADVKNIALEKKLDKLSQEERELVSHYFFNKSSAMPVDEIMADLIAWKKGNCGCYGSTLISSKDNPDLMKFLFPQLFKSIDV